MKKKLLAALMAVTLAASMTACGAPQAVDDDKDSKDTAVSYTHLRAHET